MKLLRSKDELFRQAVVDRDACRAAINEIQGEMAALATPAPLDSDGDDPDTVAEQARQAVHARHQRRVDLEADLAGQQARLPILQRRLDALAEEARTVAERRAANAHQKISAERARRIADVEAAADTLRAALAALEAHPAEVRQGWQQVVATVAAAYAPVAAAGCAAPSLPHVPERADLDKAERVRIAAACPFPEPWHLAPEPYRPPQFIPTRLTLEGGRSVVLPVLAGVGVTPA